MFQSLNGNKHTCVSLLQANEINLPAGQMLPQCQCTLRWNLQIHRSYTLSPIFSFNFTLLLSHLNISINCNRYEKRQHFFLNIWDSIFRMCTRTWWWVPHRVISIVSSCPNGYNRVFCEVAIGSWSLSLSLNVLPPLRETQKILCLNFSEPRRETQRDKCRVQA